LQFQLLITVAPDGQVHVQGPLQQKIACLGVLDMARKAVHDFDPKKGPDIVLADRMPPSLNGGRK